MDARGLIVHISQLYICSEMSGFEPKNTPDCGFPRAALFLNQTPCELTNSYNVVIAVGGR